MDKVIIDDATRTRLANLDSFLEFCDSAGRTLGYFRPEIDRSLYKNVKSPLSEEELDRREATPGGRTLAEIMADLEKRP